MAQSSPAQLSHFAEGMIRFVAITLPAGLIVFAIILGICFF